LIVMGGDVPRDDGSRYVSIASAVCFDVVRCRVTMDIIGVGIV